MELIRNNRFKATIKLLRAFFFISLFIVLFLSFVLLGILSYAKTQGAPPLAVPLSTLFYAEDGTLIGEKSHHGETRYWVTLDEIAQPVIDATVSIEDRSYFQHNGFDYKRIAGAVLADLKAMAKVQGASTITQQYARNLFLGHEKTWNRKLTEALYTIRLEMNYSKEEILEGYLNTIYYGHGVYGIEAAANYYFGKHASELAAPEAAMLAGIPKGPNRYSPLKNWDRAKQRQKIVLHAMVDKGVITENVATSYYEEPLHFSNGETIEKERLAPYFQDLVMNELTTNLNLDEVTIETEGLRVYTTLDPTLQRLAEENIQSNINEKSDIQAGFIAMDPKTAHVKALIGGRNYEESPFNRVTQAVRQPGSTFKPFLYYAALESGFTPSTSIRSEVTTFMYDEGRAEYTPHNYNNYYANDSITLAQALALSDNVYAVKTHLFLGQETLVKTAKRLGISSELEEVPSLALGTSGVSLMEMANAYSTIANGGKLREPVFITRVENYKGEVIYETKEKGEQVLDPDIAFVTTHLMTGIFDEKLNDYTKITGNTIRNKLTRFYAGKTGSTKTDNWMIGFSPQLVTGVWTGYDKGQTIDLVAERQYPKNIWADFMEAAHKNMPPTPFKPPEGVVGVYVNPDNGLLATKGCPISRLTYYKKGTEPTEYCMDHLEGETNEEHKVEKDKKEEEKKGFFKKIFDWF